MAPFYGDSLLTMIFLFFLMSNVFSYVHGYHYSREELFSHRPGYSDVGISAQISWDDTFFISVENAGSQNNNKHGGQQRKRGRRGGHLVKCRKKFSNTPLPTIILSNVNRLYNKKELFSRIDNDKDLTHCRDMADSLLS